MTVCNGMINNKGVARILAFLALAQSTWFSMLPLRASQMQVWLEHEDT